MVAELAFHDGGPLRRVTTGVQAWRERVTLYRWVGSREQLLVEVIWSLGARTLEQIGSRVRARDPSVVQIVVSFLDAVISNEGMKRWLPEEEKLRCGCSPASTRGSSRG